MHPAVPSRPAIPCRTPRGPGAPQPPAPRRRPSARRASRGPVSRAAAARAQTMTARGPARPPGPAKRGPQSNLPPLPAQLLPAALLLAASAWPPATLRTLLYGVPEGKDGHWTVPVAVRVRVRGKFVLPWVSERESRPPLAAAPFPSCRLPASPPPRWALNSRGPARPPRLRRRLRLRLLPRPLFLLLLPPPPGPLGGRQRGRSRGLGAGRGAGGAGPAAAGLAWRDAPARASARPPCSPPAGPPAPRHRPGARPRRRKSDRTCPEGPLVSELFETQKVLPNRTVPILPGLRPPDTVVGSSGPGDGNSGLLTAGRVRASPFSASVSPAACE